MTTFAHDPEALLAHDSFVRSLTRSLLLDEAQVDDVVQQTWLAALTTGPEQPTRLRSWLGSVARNLARKMRVGDRHRSEREREAAVAERLPSADEVLERENARRKVVEAVVQLDDPYRTTMLLRYFDGLPPREVARRLGVPVETVRTRIKRALEMLRARLDREHGGDRKAWGALLLPFAMPSASVPAPAIAKVLFAAGVVLAIGASIAVWVRHPQSATVPMIAAPLTASLPSPSRPGSAPDSSIVRSLIPPSKKQGVEWGALVVRALWADRSPAAHTVLEVTPRTLNSWWRVKEITTDDAGIARAEHLMPGRFDVSGALGGGAEVDVAGGADTQLTLEIPPGLDVDGRVVDQQGSPIAGASIQVFGHLVTHTDAMGKFALRSFDSSTWIAANAPGFAPSQPRYLLGKTGIAPLTIVLSTPGGDVVGVVVDAGGSPVANARVMAVSPAAEPQVWDVTNAAGEFACRGLAQGPCDVIALADAYPAAAQRVEVVADHTASARIVLLESGAIHGVVTDASGNPVAKARIAGAPSNDSSFLYSEALTAADGSFLMHEVVPGLVHVRAYADGRGSAEATLSVASGDDVEWRAQLIAGASISGRITDQRGMPLAQWQVRVHNYDGSLYVRDVTTDADGWFTAKDVREIPHRVELRPPDYRRVCHRDGIRPGDDASMQVDDDVLPTCSVRGRVLDADGEPVGGAAVVMQDPLGSMFYSEAGTGRFDCGLTVQGPCRVFIHVPALGEMVLPVHELARSETWDVGDVQFAKPGMLLAILHRAAGTDGEASVTVQVPGFDWALYNGVLSLLQDRASSQALVPGDYFLHVDGPGIAHVCQPVAIRSGAESSIDITLAPGAHRTVRFATADGSTIFLKRLHYTITHEDGRPVIEQSRTWRVGTTFDLDFTLAPGTYRVEGRLESRSASGVLVIPDLSPSDDVLTLRL